MSVIALVAYLLTDDSVTLANLPVAAAIGVIGMSAAGAVLWLAGLTVLRHRRISPAPVALVVVVGVVTGVTRSAVTYVGIEVSELQSATSLFSRLALGALLGALAWPVTSYLLDAWDQFSHERRNLLDSLADEQWRLGSDEQFIAALRVTLAQRAQAQVDSTLESVRQRLDGGEVRGEIAPEDALNLLKNVADRDLRQVSHKLWPSQSVRARLRVRDVLSVMVRTRPYAPQWVVTPLSVLGILVLARVVEWWPAIVTGAVFGLYVAVVMESANRFIGKYAARAKSVFVCAEVALAFSGVMVAGVLVLWGYPLELAATWGLAAVFTAVVTAPLSGIGPSVANQAERVLANLRESIDRTEVRATQIERQAVLVEREIARHLHGTVRAQLTAISLRLEYAVRSGDERGAAEAIEEARKVLTVDIEHELSLRMESLDDALSDLVGAWRGLIDIDVMLEPQLDLSPHQVQTVIELVTQAVQDAARHARATWVRISVSQRDSELVVTVDNDGSLGQAGSAGLGTRSLEAWAPGEWSRHVLPDGRVRLKVDLRD